MDQSMQPQSASTPPQRASLASESNPRKAAANDTRANDLDGRDWTRFSISVWNDIRFTAEELRLRHPAMFPTMLVERCIRCFTRSDQRVILDPFCGSGSTLVAARNLDRNGIGFELYDRFIELAQSRLRENLFAGESKDWLIYQCDSRRVPEKLAAESVDFCITSPPYWDILMQKRTADNRAAESYGNDQSDLGTIGDYRAFVGELGKVFTGVHSVLKPGAYCVVNVMDLRKKSRFFPLHSDLARELEHVGFEFDDIIIWDRRQEYNNLRCLGYPYRFRVNKIHEFLLIFRKSDNSSAEG